MVSNTKIDQGIIDKLKLVEEFLGGLYAGKRAHKDRIAFISNTVRDVIDEIEVKQDRQGGR